ncbi:MAG: carboxypeptidase-like regulatory domain-containing protein [Sphingobacteriales bacterium]
MGRNKLLAGLLVALPMSLVANATSNNKKMNSGETCITGIVIDGKTKKPIQGVTISATSSKLQGEKEISSNNQGGFRFESVPVNDLMIMFEKKGYRTVRKEGSKLKEGELMKLTIELIPQLDDEEGMESPLRPIIGTGFGGDDKKRK